MTFKLIGALITQVRTPVEGHSYRSEVCGIEQSLVFGSRQLTTFNGGCLVFMGTTKPSDGLWDRHRLDCLVPGKSFVQWTEEELKKHARFSTIEDAEEFYNAYSVGRGFVFRTADTKYTDPPNRTLHYKRWICCKAGKKMEVPDEKRLRTERKVTRTGCKADLAIKWTAAEQCFRVTRYNSEHNHDYLTSRETRTLPSHNKLTQEQRQQARELSSSGVQPAKIMSLMAKGSGGYRNLGFKVRNLYNFMNADLNDEIRDGDAQAMLSYLASKVKNGDRNLFCKYRVDKDDRLCHMFWADSKSRRDYHYYNEMVIFDATYKINCYDFPLVLIVGINNHAQTVLLGACLMRDETTESYAWMLQTFMECMQIKEGPPLVLTDSDRAMIAAIAIVFPNSLHRCCSWHIMRNFQSYVSDPGFKDVFMRCMTKINTEEDFEEVWQDGIQKFGLQDNDWLNHMYAKRYLWAEYMFTPTFSANQTTTSRSESINSFFKRFIQNHKLRLYSFMCNFDDATQRLRENEVEADAMNKISEPPLVRSLSTVKGWQESGGKFYTRAVYKMVLAQIELHVALVGTLQSLSADSNMAEYTVCLPGSTAPARRVLFHRDSGWAECSCGYMTECGIPCRHIFVALKSEAVKTIPEILVLKRWTMQARDVEMPPGYLADECDRDIDIRQLARIGRMESLWIRVRDSASKTDEGFNEVVVNLTKLKLQCEEYAEKSNNMEKQSGNVSGEFSACSNIVRDPERVRNRVVNQDKSKGKAKQGGTSSVRHCALCGQEGHDRRRCPLQYQSQQHEHSQHQTQRQPHSQQQTDHGQQQQHPQYHQSQQHYYLQQQYHETSSGFQTFGDDQNSQHGWNY